MERPRDALPEGTKLAGYVIGHVLGRGGFGVTYFGHDALFPDAKVAIKEFLPSGLAVRVNRRVGALNGESHHGGAR